jgi:glutaminyl-peptide cyclotransferase
VNDSPVGGLLLRVLGFVLAGAVFVVAMAFLLPRLQSAGVPIAPTAPPSAGLIQTGVPEASPDAAAALSPTPAASATPTVTGPVRAPGDTFDGDRALEHVREQMAFGPRPTGSEASRMTADTITSYLSELGWETETRPFVYMDTPGQNLVAKLGEAGGPVRMFGAHYDTRRRADQDPQNPEAPVPGANDGASGVAVLLELARVMDLSQVDGQVWLVFFDAEDNGHLDGWEYVAGSRIFVSELAVSPEYLVLVDMIGDADQNIYYEQTSDAALRERLWEIAAEQGYEGAFIPELRYSMLDDHTPFLEAGIPAVDLIDFDYPYWHTTEDTLDKVSAASLERVGRVLEAFIEAGATYDGS